MPSNNSSPDATSDPVVNSSQYRQAAMAKYRNLCVVCGFGIPEILEVAHLNHDRKDNHLSNLAVLCPNCHKMHDIGLIPTEVVRSLRDARLEPNWSIRVKDAGAKAAAKRRANAAKVAKSEAGKKAWKTRLANGA
jgi:hypothetical protein